MKPSHFRFETERLKNGPMRWEFTEAASLFDLTDDPEYRFLDPVLGDFKLTLVSTTVLMEGTVKTIATSPCARCLEEIRIPLIATTSLVFMEDDRLKMPERYPELVDDSTHWFDGEAVYPANQLRELLLLELPTVPACELEPDDICPITGKKMGPLEFGAVEEPAGEDEDEDPKTSWQAQMKKLRKNLEEGGTGE